MRIDPKGYDAGKKIKGRKRHIVTDTEGHMVGLVVHEADVQDRDGAVLVPLEIEGLEKFDASWAELLETVSNELDKA